MADFIQVADLAPFADIEASKAYEMIRDATAMATLAAPCLVTEPSPLADHQVDAVRAILRGAILRWHEVGSGAIRTRQETTGPFGGSETTEPAVRRGMFWPSELTQLQNICREAGSGGAFAIDTTPTWYGSPHLDTCSVNFGGGCSCGIILTAGAGYYP